MRRACWATALSCLSCMASYSPPVRALHAGMPGGLEASRTEVQVAGLGWGTATGVVPPSIGGLIVGRGLSSTVAVEVGTSFNAFAAGWWMSFAGLRLTHAMWPFALDAEGGVGAGFGGHGHGQPKVWFDLPAVGGYLGLGVGVAPRPWLGLYVRAKAEASTGPYTPQTLWTTALLGAEFSFWQGIAFGVSGGYAAFHERTRYQGWLYQAHFTVRP